MVNVLWGFALSMGLGFPLILLKQFAITNHRQIKAMLMANNAIAALGIFFRRSLQKEANIQVLINNK
jgi:hypothetical protein